MNRKSLAIRVIVLLLGIAESAAQDTTPNFTRDVFPVLQRACLECHGAHKQEGELRLDGQQNLIAAGLVDQDNPDASELMRRITLPRNHHEVMPATGDPLSATEIAVLRWWVSDGAAWPDSFETPAHWSYVVPTKVDLSETKRRDWGRSDIDAFVYDRLMASGLKPSPPAEPISLIRRVYFDLIGLPPSPEEVDAFVRDPSDDNFCRVVDDLLQRPQFGEKWARHWLDLARYADSHGFQRDDLRDNWAWRDWVIRALNDDMPFDQFTIEQIAGDLLPNATESQRIATGFHRCAPTNVEAGSLPEETRAEQLIDRVNTTSTVWLGTTMECVQCHDHKYDPFTVNDYYGLLGYFNNTAIEADRTNPRLPSSIAFQGPSMTITNPERDRNRASLMNKKTELEALLSKRREELDLTIDDWIVDARSNVGVAPVTHLVQINEFRSLGNTDTIERQADGAVLLVGSDPPSKDSYTLKASIDLKGIRAFRLDALTHETLPGTGPGRGDPKRTNFVLNEFTVSISRGADSTIKPLKFISAKADFSQDKWDVLGAIDGDPVTGWAIAPQFSQSHWATFELEQPLDVADGDQLTIEIHQNYGNARTIGCFRLSAVTGNPETEGTASGLSEEIASLLRREPANWSEKERRSVVDFRATRDDESKQIRKQIDGVQNEVTKLEPDTTLVMVEQEPRPTYIFERGDYRKRGPEIQPGTPAVLHPVPAGPANRLTLARWLVDPANPLVARVTVNRWWAEIFGAGLVRTPEDFGVKGERPAHPELLDWLAVEFMQNEWSMKHLLRTIILSSTYRQSSHLSPEAAAIDDQNRLLARGPRFRLDAEAVRDTLMSVSGLMDLTQFGPPIRPAQPNGLWAKVGGQQYDYIVSEGTEKYRRGIYIVHKRSVPNPGLMTFDGSSRLACTVQRTRTNTPLQALTLLNDPVYVEAARALAHRILSDTQQELSAEDALKERIILGFRLCTSRPPTAEEQAVLTRLFRDQSEAFSRRPEDVKRLTQRVPVAITEEPHEIAAWYSVSSVLLNMHETITKP